MKIIVAAVLLGFAYVVNCQTTTPLPGSATVIEVGNRVTDSGNKILADPGNPKTVLAEAGNIMNDASDMVTLIQSTGVKADKSGASAGLNLAGGILSGIGGAFTSAAGSF